MPLTDVRGSVDSVYYRAATVRELRSRLGKERRLRELSEMGHSESAKPARRRPYRQWCVAAREGAWSQDPMRKNSG